MGWLARRRARAEAVRKREAQHLEWEADYKRQKAEDAKEKKIQRAKEAERDERFDAGHATLTDVGDAIRQIRIDVDAWSCDQSGEKNMERIFLLARCVDAMARELQRRGYAGPYRLEAANE